MCSVKKLGSFSVKFSRRNWTSKSMTAVWLEESKCEQERTKQCLIPYFAANGVNSSCAMFHVVSLDWISFNASSLIFVIPSFQLVRTWEDKLVERTHYCYQGIHCTGGARLSPLHIAIVHQITFTNRSLQRRKRHLVCVSVGKE